MTLVGPEKKTESAETTGSQLTSSDKLSALPSRIRSPPAGRSATAATGSRPNKSNSGSAEGTPSELPPSTTTTPEARFAQPSTLSRSALQISHSLSDSAAEFGTLQRQRISFDSERGSSTSPRPSEYLAPCHDAYIPRFWSTQRPADDRPLPTASEPILPSTHGTTLSSFVARAHDSMHGRLRRDSFYKYKSGHSRRASQARRNSAESHTRSRTGSPQRSPSPSRGVLPLRSLLGRFSPLGRAQSREDPFIPVDPFRLHGRVSLNPFSRCFGARRRPADEEVASPRPGGSSLDLPPCGTCACVSLLGSARFHNVHLLAFDTFPRQLYLHMHLRLPSLYFSRVALIFEDAAVSRPEIQKIIDAVEGGETENVQGRSRTVGLPFPEEWVPPNVSPALARFKRSWENFVDSLVKEWKTLNVLSALLLSCSIFVFRAHINPLTFYVPTQSYFDVVSNT